MTGSAVRRLIVGPERPKVGDHGSPIADRSRLLGRMRVRRMLGIRRSARRPGPAVHGASVLPASAHPDRRSRSATRRSRRASACRRRATPSASSTRCCLAVLHFRRETEGRIESPASVCTHRPDDAAAFERALGVPRPRARFVERRRASRRPHGGFRCAAAIRILRRACSSARRRKPSPAVPATAASRTPFAAVLAPRIAGGDTRVDTAAQLLGTSAANAPAPARGPSAPAIRTSSSGPPRGGRELSGGLRPPPARSRHLLATPSRPPPPRVQA